MKHKQKQWSNQTLEQKLETYLSMMDKAILSYPNLIKRSLIAGLFTGLGATVGVTLIFLLLSGILRLLGGVEFLKGYVDFINNQVEQVNPTKR